MSNLLQFLPIFQETAASIRSRMDTDANAGLSPDDPRYMDTREGGFYFDVTQVALLEVTRLWDALSVEVVAAAFPQYAWGEYLDYHGEKFGIARKDATRATGEVTIVGTAGAAVPAGTVVSADPADDDDDEIEFVITAAGVLSAGIASPAGVVATPETTGGTLASGSYYYSATAINAYGETLGSAEVAADVAGPTARVVLDWPDVPGAVGYRVYRRTDLVPGFRVGEVAASTFADVGAVHTGVGGPPDVNTTAGATVAVEAREPGASGNVAAYAISNVTTPDPALDAVANVTQTAGGTEEESDEQLRDRIVIMYQGAGGGNANDYRRWALARPGVGRAFVNPLWKGPGTVQVVVTSEAGDPVPTLVLTDLQELLDPPPVGRGAGLAPIGAVVTVQTPTAVLVYVQATIVFQSGYNLDGTGGLIGLRGQIERALSDYLDALDVGEDVVFDHVKAQFFGVPGVYTVSAVTVNSATADIALSADPPQVAQFAQVTLA